MWNCFCGAVLFIASSLQQAGIVYTTAGKAGFVTVLYIVIVPVIGIFLHRKMPLKMWLFILMSCIQFFTAGLLMLICMFIFEKPVISDICDAGGTILYAGIMSCGAAYTLQILGQLAGTDKQQTEMNGELK